MMNPLSCQRGRRRLRGLIALMACLGLAACENVDLGFDTAPPPPPPPPPPPTQTVVTGFEDVTAEPDGSFTIGTGSATATFTGGELRNDTGLARAGVYAWHVAEDGTGEVTFGTPPSEVDFWFRNERDAPVVARVAPAVSRQVVCGVADQGLDNTEAFGSELFARGGFNDWGNPLPVAPYNFVNFGGGEYQAEFEVVAGTYEFKIADAGWALEYSNEGAEDVVVDVAATLPGGPAVGAANSVLVIAEDGCYHFEFVADTSAVPSPSAVLTVTKVEEDGGNGEPARSVVRVLDEDDAEIASFTGTTAYQQVTVTRAEGETRIGRIEVENLLATAAAQAQAVIQQVVCGVADQGLDNTEAFGSELFARGGFNDWGNPLPVAPYNFVNFGGGEYQAEFEVVAGTYEFKIADAGWALEYSNEGAEDVVVDVAATLPGGPAVGAANSVLVIAEDGCYHFEFVADTSAVPSPSAVLTVTKVEEDNGGGGGGGGDAGVGWVSVDDFEFTVGVEEPGTKFVTIFYTRPGGDYSGTTIEITTADGTFTQACVPTADSEFGCSVTIEVGTSDTITFTVSNDGVEDPAGAISVGASDTDGNIYQFSGSTTVITQELPVLPGPDEVVLVYKRNDVNYAGWGLHLWQPNIQDWTVFTGGEYFPEVVDEELGAFFRIVLPENADPPYSATPTPVGSFPDLLGFIIHNGGAKDPGSDQFIQIAQTGNFVFVFSGINVVATTPDRPLLAGAQAHWVTADTLLWDAPEDTENVALYHSASASLSALGTSFVGEDGIVELVGGGTNPFTAASARGRNLAALAAWTLPAADAAEAATLVKSQLIALARDAGGITLGATTVQLPLVLDDLYDEAAAGTVFGPSFDSGTPTLRVWAPTAFAVEVNLYDEADDAAPSATEAMDYDADSGVWSITGTPDWDRKYYTYTVNVFAPTAGAVIDNEATDPYSVSLSAGSANGRKAKSQIVDLDDPDLAPEGWDTLEKPALAAPEDIVLYELHVRDFSVRDSSVPAADRGKYTAFASNGSGVQHLAALADAGLTHVHILPVFDIATVNELRSQRVEIDDPVEDLCAANAAADSLCDDFPGMTIEEVMAAQPGNGALQQQIVEWMHDLDGFNWGYDPYHYNVPEGSYASDPDGEARIREFRTMVKGLSDIGLRTVMDVVYNHTNASAHLSDRSVLDKIVPGYYQRLNQTTGTVTTDSCCQDTASENAMMEKLIVDSTVSWVRDYKVDGFRFDIMGFHSRATMEQVRDAIQAVTPEAYVYGEGWNFGDVANDRRFVQATQANLAGTGIGSFSDRIRDGIRGGGPFDAGAGHLRNQGFISGQYYDPNAQNSGAAAELSALLTASDWIRLGMAGNLRDYELVDRNGNLVTGEEIDYKGQDAGYTDDPQEVINYAEAHDNETLWDISQYKQPTDTSTADRVRAQNVGTDLILLAQGIPFLHAGQELLRSKSMDRNSYDSGDWFNRLDFTYSDNNFAVGEPRNGENAGSIAQIRDVLLIGEADPAMTDIAFAAEHVQEMLRVRKSSRLFRLRTGAEIVDRVAFHNTGPDQVPGLIVMSIEDGSVCSAGNLDAAWSKIVVVVNATTSDETYPLFTDETLELHPELQGSVDPIVQTAAHSAAGFFVPARTSAVFVQADEAADCGPFGADVFVRGSMNDWGTPPDAKLQFVGDQGEVTLSLQAEQYFFKIADEGWTAPSNCGAGGGGGTVTPSQPFTLSCNADSQNLTLDLTSEAAGDYVFHLDASDVANPVLTVTSSSLDVTPPTIELDAVDSPVAGTVVLRATASDDFGIAAVRFLVDDNLITSDATSPYSTAWDSTTVADGPHTLTAEAEDTSGNTAGSNEVAVNVDNSGGSSDVTPPEVSVDAIASPLSGTVTLAATATDDVGVVEVRFYYEGTLIDSVNDEPYEIPWDTTTVANGDYDLTAEAEDGAGNVATSLPVAATVDNIGTYGIEIYVRGTMNDWADPPPAEAELQFLGNDTYGVTLSLLPIAHAFKIADASATFDVVNCGSTSLFTPLIAGEPFSLGCGAGSNDARFDLSYENMEDYTFVLDASDPDNPVLTVTSTAAGPPPVPGDVTAPTVSVDPVASPASGDVVVTAQAADANAVKEVRFFVDGALFWSDSTEPYQAPWDSESVGNGDHDLTAEATDSSDNVSTSSAVSVTVDNLGPFGVELYARGSWDVFNPAPEQGLMDYLGAGAYQTTVTLDSDTHRFKIADLAFTAASNCGPAADGEPAILSEPLQILCGEQSQNAKLDASLEPDQTDYVFTLDASASLSDPLVTVAPAAAGPAPTPGDTTAPTVSVDPIASPASFTVTVSANAVDDNDVASVRFFVDGDLIWADFTAPYEAPWDTTRSADGVHAVTATALDANGNVGSSAPVAVTVDNPEFGPFGVEMFLRGSFNAWDTSTPITFLGGGAYEVTVNLASGLQNFKVADAGWTADTNCGALNPGTLVPPGQLFEMTCNNASQNISLNLIGQPAGDYTFTIDATGFPATSPTVVADQAAP